MNIRDLQYLLAVAEHQHFGKAAIACHISQPALSMQLKKLEDELGVMLFERSNKQVYVTDAGKKIVAEAQQTMLSINRIKHLAQNEQDPNSSDLYFGAFPTIASFILPKIVKTILKKTPKRRLFLVEDKTEKLLDKLKKGDLDAVVLALPIDEPMLEFVELFEDPFLLAVSTKHPLAKKTSVTTADLMQHQLLLLEEGHCLRQHALDICVNNKADNFCDFRATSLETLRQMVIANVGATLMPSSAVIKSTQIKYIPFKGKPPSRKVALLWRRSSVYRQYFLDLASLLK